MIGDTIFYFGVSLDKRRNTNESVWSHVNRDKWS